MAQLRAAVIGVGYLGRIHAQKFASLSGVTLAGVVDTDTAQGQQVAAELGCDAYSDYSQLLPHVDLVSIVVPTSAHYQVARDCLQAGCHILLEKPLTETVAQAQELIALAQQHRLLFQVGHLERFNPAIVALEQHLHSPMFIEAHRLAPYRPRGTDVNVVLDLMIHDLDILLSLVPCAVKSVNSVGVPVLSSQVDIANARVQFENGCVANVTASRVSREGMRKFRIFQKDAYLSVDCQNRHLEVFARGGDGIPVPQLPEVTMQQQSYAAGDPLLAEIEDFVAAVGENRRPRVAGEDGLRALQLAHDIMARLHHDVSPMAPQEVL